MTTFYQLSVARTTSLINGFAKSIQFTVPECLQDKLAWQAGQYVIIELTINGELVQRAYTISTSPHANRPLQITVKRTHEGLASNYINDHIVAGNVINVSRPAGKFVLVPEKTICRQHFFFAAGSGITPMMAMIESTLLAEPHSTAHLLYGNHSDKTIIFKDELTTLGKRYPSRFSLAHVFSSPRDDVATLPWRIGRIDAMAIKDFLELHRNNHKIHCYICGPGSMNNDCRDHLLALGIDSNNIQKECFIANAIKTERYGVPAVANIYLDNKQYSVSIKPHQTLLSAFRQADIDPPFSCQSGTCGDCQATLTLGEVKMVSSPALNQREIDDGVILTCQSFANTDKLKVVYES